MIQEEAYVEEVGEGVVWVVKNRTSGCSACSQACLSSITSSIFAGKQFRLQIHSKLALHAGDKVMLGIDDDGLVRVSFGIYLLPLLFFFTGAMFGVYAFTSELAGVFGGLLGLLLCFAGYKTFKFGQQSCQVVILHKIN